jgi:hypothetical protein
VKRAAADLPQICPDCADEFPSRVEAEKHRNGSDKCKNVAKAVYPCGMCKGR